MQDPQEKPEEYHDETETERRREAALKRMLNTPHKPHKPLQKATIKRKPKKP